MNSGFEVGLTYSRDDIYRILGVPKEKQKGNWNTGYHEWNADLFVFSTIGEPTTGGFQHGDRWDGDHFFWRGKNNSRISNPVFQRVLSGDSRVLLFTRSKSRAPFTFEGIVELDVFEPIEPVLIRWRRVPGKFALIEREGGRSGIENILTKKVIFPDELDSQATFIEGAKKTVVVNSYERDRAARQVCIEFYGTACAVCGFDFGVVYGEIGQGFIHVHHLRDLASVGEEYEVAPLEDLRPVCPNCHAMLHVQRPAMPIEQLRETLTRIRSEPSGTQLNVPEG